MVPGSNAFPLKKMWLEQCPRFKQNQSRLRHSIVNRNIAKLEKVRKEPQKNVKLADWLLLLKGCVRCYIPPNGRGTTWTQSM